MSLIPLSLMQSEMLIGLDKLLYYSSYEIMIESSPEISSEPCILLILLRLRSVRLSTPIGGVELCTPPPKIVGEMRLFVVMEKGKSCVVLGFIQFKTRIHSDSSFMDAKII
jgi:hypothetical protein